MYQEIKNEEDMLDLTVESEDEEQSTDSDKPSSPYEDVLTSDDSSDDSESEEDWKQEKYVPYEGTEDEGKKEDSPSKSPRNIDKTLEKAVEEIRKGGSLLLTSIHYGIPECVLYNKLVSRTLPDVTTLLTRADEENLVKWILTSNQCNSLVLKNKLLEKVGKLKKISRITPIFHKSKYGRLWYFHFLSSHPEIYENDGLLLKCETYDNKSGRRRQIERNKKVEPEQNVDITKKLLSAFNIKEATVVLHDCKKNEKKNVPTQVTECKSENNSSHCNDFSDDSTYPKEKRTTGKELTNTLFVKYKNKRKMVKGNVRPLCKICNKSFSDKYKLKRHQLRIHPNTEQSPVKCSVCPKQFSTKSRLNAHLKQTHNSECYQCAECNFTFKDKTSSLNHFRKMHSKMDENMKFICDVCGKNFNQKGRLKYHIIYKHIKVEKKHSCNECGKCFTEASNLKRHNKTHSKENPFSCTNCGKEFSCDYLMRSHLETCNDNDETVVKLECDRISKEYLDQISLD